MSAPSSASFSLSPLATQTERIILARAILKAPNAEKASMWSARGFTYAATNTFVGWYGNNDHNVEQICNEDTQKIEYEKARNEMERKVGQPQCIALFELLNTVLVRLASDKFIYQLIQTFRSTTDDAKTLGALNGFLSTITGFIPENETETEKELRESIHIGPYIRGLIKVNLPRVLGNLVKTVREEKNSSNENLLADILSMISEKIHIGIQAGLSKIDRDLQSIHQIHDSQKKRGTSPQIIPGRSLKRSRY